MTYDKGNVKVDKGQYQMLEVKVIYLEYIKLNLAYAISVVNQFMHDLRWYIYKLQTMFYNSVVFVSFGGPRIYWLDDKCG